MMIWKSKSYIFWDTTPCNPMKFHRFFGEGYRLHLRGRRISQSRIQQQLCLPAAFTLVSCLFFNPEVGGNIFLRNYPIIFLQELRKTTRNFSQYNRRPGRDSNRTHQEVYSVTAKPTCSTNHRVSMLVIQSAICGSLQDELTEVSVNITLLLKCNCVLLYKRSF
jgi:hypothetical protein